MTSIGAFPGHGRASSEGDSSELARIDRGDEEHVGLDADEVEMVHGDARGIERITAPDPRWGWE